MAPRSERLIELLELSKRQVGPKDHVICALSGGVDSTVAATLVHQVLGDRLHCVFVDNGLLRYKVRCCFCFPTFVQVFMDCLEHDRDSGCMYMLQREEEIKTEGVCCAGSRACDGHFQKPSAPAGHHDRPYRSDARQAEGVLARVTCFEHVSLSLE